MVVPNRQTVLASHRDYIRIELENGASIASRAALVVEGLLRLERVGRAFPFDCDGVLSEDDAATLRWLEKQVSPEGRRACAMVKRLTAGYVGQMAARLIETGALGECESAGMGSRPGHGRGIGADQFQGEQER